MSHGIFVQCMACERGEHRFCGMQLWCECEDAEDGSATHEEYEAYHERIEQAERAERRRRRERRGDSYRN